MGWVGVRLEWGWGGAGVECSVRTAWRSVVWRALLCCGVLLWCAGCCGVG